MKELEIKVIEENKPNTEEAQKIVQKLNEMLNKICFSNLRR